MLARMGAFSSGKPAMGGFEDSTLSVRSLHCGCRYQIAESRGYAMSLKTLTLEFFNTVSLSISGILVPSLHTKAGYGGVGPILRVTEWTVLPLEINTNGTHASRFYLLFHF